MAIHGILLSVTKGGHIGVVLFCLYYNLLCVLQTKHQNCPSCWHLDHVSFSVVENDF